MGDEARLVQGLAAQAAQMHQLAQALRNDPAVRAYSELQAAAQVRARLNALLQRACQALEREDTQKASTLIGEIRAEANAEAWRWSLRHQPPTTSRIS